MYTPWFAKGVPVSLSKLLLLTLIFASVNSAYAETKIITNCDLALAVITNDNANPAAPFPPLTEAFPYGRGLLDTRVPVNPENTIKAKTLGVNDWGLRIYPVSSVEQAMKHYNSGEFNDRSMQPFYLLLPKGNSWEMMSEQRREEYDNLSAKEQNELGTWEYNKWLKQGAKLIYLHLDQVSHTRIEQRFEELKTQFQTLNLPPGPKRKAFEETLKEFQDFLASSTKQASYHYKTLPIDIVNNLLGDAKEDKWTEAPESLSKKIHTLNISMGNRTDGEFFYQTGWFMPEIKGVIMLDEYFKSSVAKEMKKFLVNLLNKGYSFTINQAPRLAIDEAGTMVRSHKKVKGGSRFLEEMIQTYEKLITEGKAYSLEAWHPTGVLTAATFGTSINGVLDGESVYYPAKDDPDLVALKELFTTDPKFAQYAKDPLFSKSIDFGKLMIYILALTAQKNGLKFIDAGMVTPFTRSIGGRYMWLTDYLALKDDAAKNGPKQFDFPEGKLAPQITPVSMKDFVEMHKPKQLEASENP